MKIFLKTSFTSFPTQTVSRENNNLLVFVYLLSFEPIYSLFSVASPPALSPNLQRFYWANTDLPMEEKEHFLLVKQPHFTLHSSQKMPYLFWTVDKHLFFTIHFPMQS